MAFGRAVAGLSHARINGVIVSVVGDVSVDPTLTMNEVMTGLDSVHGRKITPKTAKIEFTMRADGNGPDLTGLPEADGIEVLVQRANGEAYIMRNATYTGDGARLGVDNGEVPLSFEADNCERVRQ